MRPKGGGLRLSASGTYDTFNPVLAKGETAIGLTLPFETLMKSPDDELLASYGLLAEGVSYPDDVSSATFRLRAEAKWQDGKPVTPEDVIFSFDKTKELNPLTFNYYKHVVKAEKTGERDVTFTFDEKNNKELPNILGQLTVVPKHWWEGTGPDGKPRDITKTTLEPVMGSGPYKIAAFSPGATIRYELRDDYWGKDLNVNVGQNNFGSITYTYYGDRDVEFEAFRAGNSDYWQETLAARWATGYDFPAVKDGRVKKEDVANALARHRHHAGAGAEHAPRHLQGREGARGAELRLRLRGTEPHRRLQHLQADRQLLLEYRACLLRPAAGSRTGDPQRPEGQAFARCLHHRL
jgi:microcin C transport system substrate-binding protein